MKKFTVAILTLALAGAGAAAFACGGPGGPGGPDMAKKHEKMLDRLDDQLDLTDEQEAKVKDVFDAAGKKHQAIHAETHKAVAGILTSEQLQKFDQMQEERKDRKDGSRKGKRDGGNADAAPAP